MNRKQLAVVFAVVGVVLVGIIALLVTGGGDDTPVPSDQVADLNDAGGDVVVGDGSGAPTDTALADILGAHVFASEGSFSFEVQMAQPIPEQIQGGSLDFRWEINEGGTTTWLLTANLDVGPNASLITQVEGSAYGSSTFDESFPGEIVVEGDRLVITLRPDELPADAPAFPASFGWVLQTSLDGSRGDPTSALAQDRMPDTGEGGLETR